MGILIKFFNEHFLQIPQSWEGIIIQWGGTFFRLILIIILAKILFKAGSKFIEGILKTRYRGVSLGEKALMFSGLFKSLFRYLIFFIAALMILREFRVDLTPIIAGAGIAGLAIGFGAQSLMKDIITGLFIIIEDQFSVGDYITVDNLSGVVEQMGLRSSKIRDFGGQLHIVPNSRIEIVTNFSRGSQRSLVEILVAYEENIDTVLEILNNLCAVLAEKYSEITEGPTVLGVSGMNEESVTIQIIALTEPMKQWYIEREMRREIRSCLLEKEIKIPHPRRTVYIRHDPDRSSMPGKDS